MREPPPGPDIAPRAKHPVHLCAEGEGACFFFPEEGADKEKCRGNCRWSIWSTTGERDRLTRKGVQAMHDRASASFNTMPLDERITFLRRIGAIEPE